MPRQAPPARESDALAFRVGGAAAGLLGGLFIGTVLAVVLFFVGAEVAARWVLLACLVGGLALGYLSATAGLTVLEAVSHFFIGAVSGIAQHTPEPSELAPRWLRWVFYVGVALGLATYCLRRW